MATQVVRDVMTTDPQVLNPSATLSEAARVMSQCHIGDVIVGEGGTIRGIVTDRDIVVRAIAEGREPATTPLADVCSSDLATLAPGDTLDHAVKVIREKAVRRLPVVDGDQPVGILSIGDLAIDLDGRSALADVSAAPANA